MYKPTCFVPEISLPIFTYISHWYDGNFPHNIHHPDLFNLNSLSPALKQDKGIEHFDPPRESWEIFFSQ